MSRRNEFVGARKHGWKVNAAGSGAVCAVKLRMEGSWGVAKHTTASAWWARVVFSREGAVLHENLAEERGGERRHISAAVRRSKTIIGPPHRGQDQVEVEGGGVEQPSSSPGGGPGAAGKSVGRPRNWKQRGKSAARRRWARKPK